MGQGLFNNRRKAMDYEYDRKYVRTTKELAYGNPGERRVLKAGTLATAHAATNLPNNSAIHYWLTPIGDWPECTRRWAEAVGCGARSDELELVSPSSLVKPPDLL